MPFSEKEALIKAANHYIETLNQIGALQTDYQPKDIEPLCSVNCKKIRNGKVLFEGKDLLQPNLMQEKNGSELGRFMCKKYSSQQIVELQSFVMSLLQKKKTIW